jgi:hypothetical protein
MSLEQKKLISEEERTCPNDKKMAHSKRKFTSLPFIILPKIDESRVLYVQKVKKPSLESISSKYLHQLPRFSNHPLLPIGIDSKTKIILINSSVQKIFFNNRRSSYTLRNDKAVFPKQVHLCFEFS